MKRKVFEESLYFPSKSRRLDGELIQTAIEEPRSMENEVFTTTAFKTPSETAIEAEAEAERALVLYNPANTPFLRSPTSPDFSFILNHDLVPGIKDFIFWPGNSNKVKPAEDTNDCLALVPWVGSQFPQASATDTPSQSEPMESEDVDMMDTEETNDGLQSWQQQTQQQHCMPPQLLHNKFSHVTW